MPTLGQANFITFDAYGPEFVSVSLAHYTFDLLARGKVIMKRSLGWLPTIALWFFAAATTSFADVQILPRMSSTGSIQSKALAGDAAAQEKLGEMYYLGSGITQDTGEALKWFRLAADQGVAEAFSNIGAIYMSGDGVAPNLEEGIKFTRLAAERGVPAAQLNLGTAYRAGKGVTADEVEGYRLIELAANQGYGPAQYHLGQLYFAKRREEAAKWFILAASNGDVGSQSELGFMYANGWGVPLDMKKAAEWSRLAAEKGDTQAQVRLGNHYATGDGVEKNYSEAMKWYRLVAEKHGCLFGCSNIGLLYAYGQGAAENKVLAYALLTFLEDPAMAERMQQTFSSLDQSISCDEFVTATKLALELGKGNRASSKIDKFIRHPYSEKYQGKSEQRGNVVASQRCASPGS
jgi:uncharacterized protein